MLTVFTLFARRRKVTTPLDSFERFILFASQPSVSRAIVNALEAREHAGTFESWVI